MSARLMADAAFRQACLDQAQTCRTLGSPLNADILTLFASGISAGDGPVAERLLDWQGDPAVTRDALALRLTGALHGLVLAGEDPQLATAYEARQVAWPLLRDAVARHEAEVLEWLAHAPQTNEVGRSAVLIAAARFLDELTGGGQTLSLLELGCSAGLNLNFPLYSIEINGEVYGNPEGLLVLRPEWRGIAPPSGAVSPVARARGVDLSPLDPVADRLRLLAYVWPDQSDRLARTARALDLAALHPPQVDRGDAAPWLEARLNEAPSAHAELRLVYHTIAWQYFPAEVQARCEAAIQAAGQRATRENPLAHLSMEQDALSSSTRGAALRLRLWQGEGLEDWHLGRADFHGRWVDWHPERAG